MSIIYLMVPLAILLALVAVVAFYWALNSGQFDDVETPAQRILFQEASPVGQSEASATQDAFQETNSVGLEGDRHRGKTFSKN